MNHRRVTSIVLAAGLAAVLAGCGPSSAPELIAQARQALAAKDGKTAQIHLKNALQKDPRSAEARFLLGKLLLDTGDAQGALVELNKAREAGYKGSDLVPAHAKALLERREHRKLVESYQAVQLADASAQAQVGVYVAQAHARQGQAADARAVLNKVLANQPGHPQAETELARLDAQAGQLDVALARIDALLQRVPSEATAWRAKGDLETLHRKDTAAAAKAYQQAVVLAPKSPENQISLIGHLISTRDLAGAEQQLRQAKAQVGLSPALRYYTAVLYLEQGKLDAAAEQVQHALKSIPDDGRVLLLAGQVEYLRERFLQAEHHLTRALGQPGNRAKVRMLLAQTYLRMDDGARALQMLQPLLDEPTSQAPVHALAGEVYLRLGETRRAQEQFKRAAQLDPKDLRSRAMVAADHLERGDAARGIAELRDLSEGFESPAADLALVSTFIRKEDFPAALKAIEAIERKTPNSGLALTLRAEVLERQGDLAGARAALIDALKRDPKYLPAALRQAHHDFKEQKAEQAVKRLAAVVQADPDNVLTRLAWLTVRMQAGESHDAIEVELKALVQKHPQVVRVRQALVRLQLGRGDLSAAATQAQQAVAAMPTEAALVEMLADVQLRQREYTLAAKSLEQLAQLRPRAPEPLVRLAEAELSRQQPREALAAVRKALALKPSHGPALRLQVLLEAELGNVDAARRLVTDMRAVPGQEALAAVVEGDFEAGQQRHSAAAVAYRRALSRNAALPEVPARLHRALRAAGQQAEADAFAKEWFQDHPRDGAFMNYLGDVALNDRQLPQAQAQYERALALKADRSPAVLNNLAYIAQQLGDLKRAERLARDALRLAPGEAPIHDTLAEVLSAMGRHDDAVAAQRRAVELDSNAAYRVGLARRLLAAGRKDQARDELEAVQKLGKRYPGQAEVSELLRKV